MDSDGSIQRELAELGAQLPAGLIEVEWPSLRVTYMNAVAESIAGYDRGDIERGLHALTLLDASSQQRIMAIAADQLKDSVAVGLPYRPQRAQHIYEFTGIRKDGTPFPADVQSAYILDAAGFPRGVRLLVRDLTEQREREEARRLLEMQLRQSQKLDSLGQLAGGVAHELNNVLTVLMGNLHMLEGEVADRPGAAELVTSLQAATQRGARLIGELLKYARPEVESRAKFDLGPVLRSTVSLVTPSLLDETILQISDLPDRRCVVGREDAIQQVLVNILLNASDAMPGGGVVTICLSTHVLAQPSPWLAPDLADGVYHVVSISDTGTGLTSEEQERVFDPFVTSKGASTGAGLGLPVALGIARSHGGWLSVESRKGEGSTFRLVLPQGECAAGPGRRCIPAGPAAGAGCDG
ncbi:MAG: PAS domain-containing protein [Dehalococcoidia bacterium]|nr:PAS domain-containing protein [Dehalococcoidia bacterium]